MLTVLDHLQALNTEITLAEGVYRLWNLVTVERYFMPIPEEDKSEQRSPLSSQRRLRTVRQFCQAHPAFTTGGMRWLLFHRQTNGLERAVVHIGRRLLIDEDRFFAWVDEQNIPQEKHR